MSLADDVVGSEPLLAPILDLQRFSKPTTAEVLQRVQTGLLPHQIAFCQDTEHRKLGLVCGFGAGKTYGLILQKPVLGGPERGPRFCPVRADRPMLRDILMMRTMDDLEKWEIPYDFGSVHCPNIASISERARTLFSFARWRRPTGFVARTCVLLALMRPTPPARPLPPRPCGWPLHVCALATSSSSMRPPHQKALAGRLTPSRKTQAMTPR